ncbi:MAG: WG repeat-containing protein [Flavipsychrobacter sp.]|nr:WG repeat-containing protein [Flavipsychrobacter sp.]
MIRPLIHIGALILSSLLFMLSACSRNDQDGGFSYKLLPVEKDGKYGYIDHEGKWIINPQFKDAYPFSDGLALVQGSDDKYGYIDDNGRYVINPQYVGATNFSEGTAIVVSENGYPTCIDEKGITKFTLKEAELASNFKEGLAWVLVGDKYGYIDKAGKMVVSPQFDDVGFFSGGLATYAIKKADDSTKKIWGFIDKKGKIVVTAQFAILSELKEGIAYASTDGEKYGYVDKKGAYVINPQFDDAHLFNDGLASAKQGENWGYIDEKGKWVINPQFERGGCFLDGIAAVRSGKENWGYIDKKGKYLINPQFKGAESFHAGVALVASGKQIGIISKDGKYKANPQFDGAWGSYSFDFYPEYNPTNKSAVRSDFFDGSAFSKAVIGAVKEGTGLRGLNGNTTFAMLKPMLSAGTEPRPYTNELKDFADITIADGIEISQSEYSFESDLQQYSSGYFTGYYDYVPGGYYTNQNNKLTSVAYLISLDKWGKTKDKALKMAAAIKEELIKQCRVSETANENNSSERSRTVIPDIIKSTNSEILTAWFLYGEKCQYMLITNKDDNTILIKAVFSDGKSYMPKGG